MVIWNERDEIEMPMNISIVLQNFLTYRQNVLLKDYPNDNAQLITNLKLGGTVIGLGTVGGICSPSQSAAVSLNHDKRVQIVAATVAHELGHNLGMNHDDDTCQCPDKNGCIMRGSSSHQGHNHWSSCSKINIRETLESGNGFCLKNKPDKLFLESSCGNGFVEKGEECDCGLKKNCNNKCCNPLTCKLSINSTCATGSCCDLETCNFKESDNICREAASECDLPEFCNGANEFCPKNVFKHTSVECGKGKAYCFKGECKSNDDQCKMIWGVTSYSLLKCYDRLNFRGNEYGNCGLDGFGRYKPCSKGDAMCGTLQCKSVEGQVKLTAGQKMTMKTLYSDGICFGALYSPLSIGMVPNGAKCGIHKVCSNQKCIDIDDLKSNCANCNGRGSCNSNGNCHCDKGWAPPFCNMPGDGGSIDSRESTGQECKLTIKNN